MHLIADVYQPVEDSLIPANGSMAWGGLHVHHPATLPLEDELERARRTALVALNGRMVESWFKDSHDLMGKELPKVSFPSRHAGVSAYLRDTYGVTDFWSTASGMEQLISYSFGTLPEARLYDRMVTLENHSSHD